MGSKESNHVRKDDGKNKAVEKHSYQSLVASFKPLAQDASSAARLRRLLAPMGLGRKAASLLSYVDNDTHPKKQNLNSLPPAVEGVGGLQFEAHHRCPVSIVSTSPSS
jgi:hypothetical protein